MNESHRLPIHIPVKINKNEHVNLTHIKLEHNHHSGGINDKEHCLITLTSHYGREFKIPVILQEVKSTFKGNIIKPNSKYQDRLLILNVNHNCNETCKVIRKLITHRILKWVANIPHNKKIDRYYTNNKDCDLYSTYALKLNTLMKSKAKRGSLT